jgi:cytochrome c-type biogenesis protein CcmE
MWKTTVAGVIMIIVAVTVLINASSDLSHYSNFAEALTTQKKVKVVGELVKNKEMYYNPEKDPNYFSFYVKDDQGAERKVVLLQEKPQDFELSEKLVLTGKMKGDDFVASDMLMKCPSKYKDEEIYIKENG